MRFAAIAFLLAGPWVVTALGFWSGLPWLLPFLTALPAFPVFVQGLRAGDLRRTYGWMAAWALMQSLALAVLAWNAPDTARAAVWRGPEYAAEMLHWIRTGVGPEGDPSQFLPIHATHLLAFSVLCFVSFGFLGLVLGGALLNYMNYYVVELVRVSMNPVHAAAIGWPVWAALRVLGFMALAIGCSLAGWALWKRRRGEQPPPVPKAPFLWGLGLVAADALLKAALAPTWRQWLMGALGL